MKTIAVCLQKGGVGKTSIAVSLAAELAAFSGSVLLIDADPQGSASAWIGPEDLKQELADVLLEKTTPEAAILGTQTRGLFLLPTAGLGGNLRTFAESQARDDPFCIRRLIKQIAALSYAYTVIDLSPGWGAIERAAILAADEVLTPVLGDSFALDGLQIFADNLQILRERMESEKPAYNKIIVNALDGRIKQHGKILEDIKGLAESNLKIYEIPVDPAFRMAQRTHVALQAVPTVKAATSAALGLIAKDLK
jgi:chromosome partitioning protein